MKVIIGAKGTILKSLKQYMSNIAGKHDMTARNYRKQPHWALHTHTAGSTDVKCITVIKGNSITCAIYSKYRIAATPYTLETWFVSALSV
jgi:hypothetical protein